MSRPGPPLPGLVGPAEQDDREGAGRGRQVRRSGIRADEEVGPLQECGRLRRRSGCRSSRAAGRGARGRSTAAGLRFPRPPRPASRSRGSARSGLFHDRRGQRLAALPAPRCTARRGGSGENRSACSQSGFVGRSTRSPAKAAAPRVPSPGRTATPRGTGIDFDPATASARPGVREPAGDRDPILVADVDVDASRLVRRDSQPRRAVPAATGPRAGRGSRRRRRSARRPLPPSPSRRGAERPPARGRARSARRRARRCPGRNRIARSDRPRLQTAVTRPHRSGRRSNQVRSATWTRFTCGSASNTS